MKTSGSRNPSDARSPAHREPYSNRSTVQSKLAYFIMTGEIAETKQQQPKKSKGGQTRRQEDLRNQKMGVAILKGKYGEAMIQDDNGNTVNIHGIQPKDLSITSKMSMTLFRNLGSLGRYSGKSRHYSKLEEVLVGADTKTISDSYDTTTKAIRLLEIDDIPDRAIKLAHLAGQNGIVAMNAITQWLLQKGDIDGAFRLFKSRKKWGVPPNSQTFIILFDGIASSSSWGGVSKSTSEKCVEIFESWREYVTNWNKKHSPNPVPLKVAQGKLSTKQTKNSKVAQSKDMVGYSEPYRLLPDGEHAAKMPVCDVEHFNACLSVLVKNFQDDQEQAWAFFDLLNPDEESEHAPIIANSQTFTILLNGLKRHAQMKAEAIKVDRKLTVDMKTLALLNIQAKLVLTAKVILEKSMLLARPPALPETEGLDEYRRAIKKPLLNIDAHFASVFLSCYVNGFSGTGIDQKSGSHYLYNQHGLRYLRFWSPDVDNIFSFISEHVGSLSSVSSLIKDATTKRIDKAVKGIKNDGQKKQQILKDLTSVDEILPSLLLANDTITQEVVNPLVVFPPSTKVKDLASKIKTLKLEPLVKFGRVTRLKRLKASLSNLSSEIYKDPINKFLLMNVYDGLLNMGQKKELLASIWYTLRKWGGILMKPAELTKLKSDDTLFNGLLEDSSYPMPLEVTSKRLKSRAGSDTIVDIALVEKFIYMINENYKSKGRSSSRLVTDIFAALVNPSMNVGNVLEPRLKTIDVIFSCLNSDIHYYSDFNFNRITIDKKEGRFANNPPKKSITHNQLEELLPTLCKFMETLIVYEGRFEPNKYLLPNIFIDSFNNLVDNIFRHSWIDMKEHQKLQHHIQIVKAGILAYKPKQLIDFSENLKFTTSIYKSLMYLGDQIKDKKEHSRLFNAIRLLNKLQRHDSDVNEKVQNHTRTIHALLDKALREGEIKGNVKEPLSKPIAQENTHSFKSAEPTKNTESPPPTI